MEKYVLKTGTHFGQLNQFFAKGTILSVDREKCLLNVSGRIFNDLRDVEIAIRAGIALVYKEEIKEQVQKEEDKTVLLNKKIQNKKNNGGKKMEIIPSDIDTHPPIKIEKATKTIEKEKEKGEGDLVTFTGDLKVIRNEDSEEVRNMNVVRNITKDTNSKVEVTPSAAKKASKGSINAKKEQALKVAEQRKKAAEAKREKSNLIEEDIKRPADGAVEI